MDQIEAFHLNWLRFILTVNRRTPKDAVRGEFGRSPLYIEQLKHMLNYWFKLVVNTGIPLCTTPLKFIKL